MSLFYSQQLSLLAPITAVLAVFILWSAIQLVVKIRRGGTNRPPLVPYIFPWVGSAIAIGKDADAFYKQAREQHGDTFAVHVAGSKFVYTTSVPLIAAVYKNPKTFRFNPVPEKIVSVFGMSRPAVNGGWMESTFYPSHVKMLSAPNVGAFMDTLGRHGLNIVAGMADSMSGAPFTQMSLEDLIIPTVFQIISATMFGKEFPAMSIFDLFKEYDKDFPLLVAEMPKIFTRNSHSMQAKLIEVFSDALLGEFWGPQANITWAIYWILAFPLHEPNGLIPIVQELDHARAEWLQAHPTDDLLNDPEALLEFLTGAHLPLFEAHFAESLRLTSSRFSARKVAAGGATLGGYDLLEGEMVICAGRYVHLNDDIYPDATSFKPERFLTTDGRFNKKEAQKPFLAFGGGVSQCQGRHFATRACRIIVAQLLMHFDIRLDPGKPSSGVQVDLLRVGTGVLHPKTPSHVLVSRRKLMQG
ncbi:Cholesterol 7-alpha-monooxygenase [Tulasnella sp. 331]|nr:Cholesterol 7-alpha-monooxygenase [Tulasnella sp. 331]